MTVPLLAALAAGPLRAQDLSPEEARRAAPYYQYWELVDVQEWALARVQDRLKTAIREAQQKFGGRGPALARHFLHHIQASPSNTAFFFLFRAVGDLTTAQLLIDALVNPPMVEGSVLGRDPGELRIAIEAVLGNEAVRADPTVLAALEEAIRRARARPGGGNVAQIAVFLLGKCGTPDAARHLQILASDPDPALRAAALEALGKNGSSSAGPTLSRALAGDSDPGARTRAADAMAQSKSPEAVASLQASLAQETDPQVIDAIVRALSALHALPPNPKACLDVASRCWDASVAQPFFDCWRATASREDLVNQAASGSWTIRALALYTLAELPRSRNQPMLPMVVTPSPPAPLPGDINRRAISNGALDAPPPIQVPVFDTATRDRLLQSAVELLARDISGLPARKTLSYGTAQLVRDAFWEISGRNMPLALEFADRIVPLRGHYTSAGRFGESYDLAARDRQAYVALRRPRQVLFAALAALLICPLFGVLRLRRSVLAILASVGMWAVWTCFQTEVRELPPPPLCYLTVSCLAFLSAGLGAGWFIILPVVKWVKVCGAPVVAGIFAFLVCGYTRWTSLFPIGSEGWELIFDPLTCAVLASPAAFAISLVLIPWKPKPPAISP